MKSESGQGLVDAAGDQVQVPAGATPEAAPAPLMRTRVRPLRHQVVVLPIDDAAKVTDAGIQLLEQHQEKPVTGRVLAVGAQVDASEGLIVGARVLYGRYSGVGFEFDKVEVMVLRDEDCLAVIEEISAKQ